VKTRGQAPLWEALLEYLRQDKKTWHTPGHKQGTYAWTCWRQALGETTLALDLTEVPGLDNLSSPEGVIKAAQEKAAGFFGASRTFFLVNGATSGIIAVILAQCRPGDEVILPRYAHRSVFNGLILSGARPVYLETEWLAQPVVPLGVTPEAVINTLKRHPRAKLLILVHPTYEGIVPHSGKIIELAHDYSVDVLADSAHGAHFGMTPSLPPSALALGADFVVQSTHKTMGALTQAAMLHLRDNCRGARVAEALNLIQTTSPSYLLMASLDVARFIAESSGKEDWTRAVDSAFTIRRELAAAGIPCLEREDITGPIAEIDVTRLVLPVASLGFDGAGAAAALRNAGHEIEMAGADYIVIVITPGDNKRKIRLLIDSLKALPDQAGELPVGKKYLPCNVQPCQVLTPAEAWLLPRRELPLEKAEGHIAAELIAPCPPGLALTVPGEVLTEEVVKAISYIRGKHGKVLVVDYSQ